MSDELEPCPVPECGNKDVYIDHAGFAGECRGVICDHCGYMILGDQESAPIDPKTGETDIDAHLTRTHNTLARRAEIGRLVESLVEEIVGITIVKLSDTEYSAENPGSEHEAGSLLDVLRVMAGARLGKEIA